MKIRNRAKSLMSVFDMHADLIENLYTVISDAIVARMTTHGTLFTAGNGGSCCHAQHLSEELLGRYKSDRAPIPSVCLTSDSAYLTCASNDFGYEHAIERAVKGLCKAGDVLVLFSTSGNSPNLLNAAHAARAQGVRVVAFLGKDGGELARHSDLCLIVPSNSSDTIQEIHQMILHQLVEDIENKLCS